MKRSLARSPASAKEAPRDEKEDEEDGKSYKLFDKLRNEVKKSSNIKLFDLLGA